MQREILYRGKRTDNSEWVYGSFIPDLLEVYTKEPDGEWGGDWGFIKPFGRTKEERMMVEVDRNTVGQFTGMLDRNGKRIFEDDIVYSKMRYGESYGVVVFRNGRFSVDWRVRSEWSGNGISCRTDDLSPADEVVGTIFDNPELLEVKN